MTSRSRASTATLVLAVLVPLIVLAFAAWQYRWMSDDGFINLRVVRNIANGHGPVFNAGERVEASTSPMWIWVLWLANLVLPLRLEWIAVLAGIGLTLAGVAGVCLGARRLLDDRDDRARGSSARPGLIWAPIGVLILVAIAPMWKFSSSGLENGLSFAWIGAALFTLASWSRHDQPARAPVLLLIGLGPLIRPEFGILSLLLVFVIIAPGPVPRGRRIVGTLAIAFALPIAYQIFRMGYYASLIPNSALAKEASRPYWSAGWDYLRETVNPYWLWIPILAIVAGAYLPLIAMHRAATDRRRMLVLIAFPLAGLLTAAYIIRVGGDFMQARLLMPPLFMLCAPVAMIPIRRTTAAALVVVPWAIVAITTLRSGSDQPRAFDARTTNAITVTDFGFQPGAPARAWFDGRGVYFLEHQLPGAPAGHDPAVASYGIGILGYALGPDTYVLDLLGLGDAFTSHLRLDRRGTVAHEKPLPLPWIPARLLQPGAPAAEADFTLPSFFLARPIDDPGDQPFYDRVADARIVLRCSKIRDFLEQITEPLDPGRFLSNIAAAPGNTQFRIPPEPREARRQFCDEGRKRPNT